MSSASDDMQGGDIALDTDARACEESLGSSEADAVDGWALSTSGAGGSYADSYDGSAFAAADCISAGSEDERLMHVLTAPASLFASVAPNHRHPLGATHSRLWRNQRVPREGHGRGRRISVRLAPIVVPQRYSRVRRRDAGRSRRTPAPHRLRRGCCC